MASIRQHLASAFRAGMNPENPSTPLAAIAKWLNAGNQTVAGELVNESIALQITTVRACITVLAESVASLPCVLYEKDSKRLRGRNEATNRRLHYILGTEPNEEMSSFTFWETLVGSNALTGNSYAEIKWITDASGKETSEVGELYPLHPLLTEPFRQPDGTLAYRTRQGVNHKLSNGTEIGWRVIEAKDILHFKLFSLDGIRGLSPITLARQALGLTRAAEKFGARFFGNGSKPGGVLTGPEGTDEKLLRLAQDSWEASQGGSNQGRTAVLPGLWKYEQIGLSPEDSQFLATRAFQRAEISAMFRVPSHMVGDTSKISNNSYEQMNMSFVNDTLRPIIIRIEAELNRKLVPQVGSKANKYFVQFDISQRLRADHEATIKGVATGRQWSLMTVDEGRVAIGLEPIGDNSRLAPINMMNADLIPEQDVIPGTTPPDTESGDGDDDTDTDDGKAKKKDGKTPDPDSEEPADLEE